MDETHPNDRFDFVLLIPSNLCSHDRHPNAKIAHHIYAELEGLDESAAPASLRSTGRKSTQTSMTSTNSGAAIDTPRSSRSRSPFPPSTASHSPAASGTPSGTISPPSGSQIHTPMYVESTTRSPASPIVPDGNGAVNPASLTSALNSMSLRQHASNEAGPSRTGGGGGSSSGQVLPPAPPYQADQGPAQQAEVPWFKGIVKKDRYIELLHNCHPEGGVTELDVVVRDAVPGLGPFELSLESDCVRITSLSRFPSCFSSPYA